MSVHACVHACAGPWACAMGVCHGRVHVRARFEQHRDKGSYVVRKDLLKPLSQ
jgi:hypothetical protein